MARNPNNDGKGGILRPKEDVEARSFASSTINTKTTERISTKWLVPSYIILLAIFVCSFLIPESKYQTDICILLLNLELIVLFLRDFFTFCKFVCTTIKVIIIGFILLYLVNVIDLLFDIPHTQYLMFGLYGLLVVLSITYYLNFLKKK